MQTAKKQQKQHHQQQQQVQFDTFSSTGELGLDREGEGTTCSKVLPYLVLICMNNSSSAY